MVVVLDPGHDGTHGGSSANGFVEAQLNLKIAQYCKAELEEYYGVTVYMTRDSASCPNGGGDNKSCLQRRADIARDMGANLLSLYIIIIPVHPVHPVQKSGIRTRIITHGPVRWVALQHPVY